MVKALDLKSNGVSPCRFESCSQGAFYFLLELLYYKSPSPHVIRVILGFRILCSELGIPCTVISSFNLFFITHFFCQKIFFNSEFAVKKTSFNCFGLFYRGVNFYPEQNKTFPLSCLVVRNKSTTSITQQV